MTIQTISNALLIIVLLGWIGYRQLTWRPISVTNMWKMPLILGAIGLLTLSRSGSALRLTATDIGVLTIELVVSLGLGLIMGSLATFRPLSQEKAAMLANRTDRRGRSVAPAEFESRTGWLGLALWVVFIAVRIGIDAWATSEGSILATSTGVILVMVAANRAARVAVFAARVNKLDAVAA